MEYSSLQPASPLGNSHATWDHTITCYPVEVTFLSLPQQIKAGTRFSDPRGMQGGVPMQRWSPIPVLTGSVESAGNGNSMYLNLRVIM